MIHFKKLSFKGSNAELEKLHGLLGLFSMYFAQSFDADGYPGILQFTQKDSWEQGCWNGWVFSQYSQQCLLKQLVDMTKFLAVKTTENRFYVVFTIEM